MPPNTIRAISRTPIVLRDDLRLSPELAMSRKWDGLGGAPGAPVGPVEQVSSGHRRRYQNGTLYADPRGRIRYVYGAIGARYDALGGPSSWLGFPTSDEMAFVEDGRVSTFQRGAIYWWPDTGPIELERVTLSYKGLMCFEETAHDQMSSADEPYVVMGVATPSGDRTLMSSAYEDVDDGDSRAESIALFSGPPVGVALAIVVMEHDESDPNKHLKDLEAAVNESFDAIGDAVEDVPFVGKTLAKGVDKLRRELADDVAGALNDLLDLEDDKLGSAALVLTPKQLIAGSRAPKQHIKDIEWTIETGDFAAEGARYRVYLDVSSEVG